MSSDLVNIFVLSLVSMFNQSVLAPVTVMLLLPNPKRLMLGCLLGAYNESYARRVDRVLAAWLEQRAHQQTTISPAEDIVIGLLLALVAFVLATGRDQPVRERRQLKTETSCGPGRTRESRPRRCR